VCQTVVTYLLIIQLDDMFGEVICRPSVAVFFMNVITGRVILVFVCVSYFASSNFAYFATSDVSSFIDGIPLVGYVVCLLVVCT